MQIVCSKGAIANRIGHRQAFETDRNGAQLLKEDLGQGQGSDLGNECQALLEQIDALKGAPLRRSALQERYQQECQGGMNAAPPYAPPLPQ